MRWKQMERLYLWGLYLCVQSRFVVWRWWGDRRKLVLHEPARLSGRIPTRAAGSEFLKEYHWAAVATKPANLLVCPTSLWIGWSFVLHYYKFWNAWKWIKISWVYTTQSRYNIQYTIYCICHFKNDFCLQVCDVLQSYTKRDSVVHLVIP